MKNCFINAKLINYRKINVFIMSMLPFKDLKFYLKKEDFSILNLKIVKHSSTNNFSLFELEMEEDFEFGKHYELFFENYANVAIDVSDIPLLKDFDERFYYSGDDLGAIYKENETKFSLWAPISEAVFLKIENENDDFDIIPMHRDNKGVYRLTLNKNCLNKKYHYIVNNYSCSSEVNDPYGKGTSLNSLHSAVVDSDSVSNFKNIKPETLLKTLNDHIIYELNIRDFTESKFTNIANKGKYLGLVEENRKTKNGFVAGLDYLKYINVTTIQLQPILDFRGVDDINFSSSYNWGYDPISMFALEGSYSIHPEIPQSRLVEFRQMVDSLHKNNLYVTIDVVFNHVYDYLNLCFEKIVPNYFFRKKNNGEVSSASGCGNDFASEKKMARKSIVDSLIYLISTFDIDGIRFDLMGLIDIETIKEAYKKCKEIKENIVFYGEGWDMGYELPKEDKCAIINADKLLDFSFFNDSFRNILKGSTNDYDLNIKGFVGGDLSYTDGAIYALLGSCSNYCFKNRFFFPHQSLNYIECHDNHTLFDKLLISNPEESIDTILSRIKFSNSLINLAFGVPFFHMGQEIGLSKYGLGNTYNVVKVNDMDYSLMEKRFDMVQYFRLTNILRKNTTFLKCDDINLIFNSLNVHKFDNGLIAFSLKENASFYDFKKLYIIINPTLNMLTYEFDNYLNALFYNGGYIEESTPSFVKNAIFSPLSLSILYKK